MLNDVKLKKIFFNHMKLLVKRTWKKDTYTIGILYINGVRFSETMEDMDRGLNDKMSVEEIKKKKVYGETAIPTGTYEIDMNTVSPKFKTRIWGQRYNGKIPRIKNVKGFDGVLIHPLNTAKDSLGCIGVGRNTVKGMITNSTTFFYKLMDNYLLPAHKKGEKITLVIE